MKDAKKQRASKPSPTKTPSRNWVRIIGGAWRGRRLYFPDSPGLRPTPDRVRETLFNWLTSYIVNARCLDLFGGSGALGFEALSRGAGEVVMLEQHPKVMQAIQQNATRFLAKNIQMLQTDSIEWLAKSKVEPFDIVFLDPPYQSDLLKKSIQLLEEKRWLKEGTLIYFEKNVDTHFMLDSLPKSWHIIKRKHAGQVDYFLVARHHT